MDRMVSRKKTAIGNVLCDREAMTGEKATELIQPSSLAQRHLPPGLGRRSRLWRWLAGWGTMPFSM